MRDQAIRIAGRRYSYWSSRGGKSPSSHDVENTKPASSLYQDITDKIIAELEQGRVPWNAATIPLGLPKNAATGRA